MCISHPRLLPEVNLNAGPASINPKTSLPGSTWFAGNFNPALNALSAQQLARELPAATAHLRSAPATSTASSADQDFFGSNPYWLRADQVEEYRASLYGKLAHNAAGTQAAHKMQAQQCQSGSSTSSLPLPTGFRPAFFTSSSLSGASESVSDDSVPPPYSPRRAPASHFTDSKSPKDVCATDMFAAQQQASSYSPQLAAAVGGIASQTLFSRMTQAFLEAFAGPSPGANAVGGPRTWDANKVAAVLSGQARIEIVQQPSQSPAEPAAASVEGLGLQLGGLSLDTLPRSRSSSPGPSSPAGLPCSFEEIRRRWCGQ